MSGGSVFGRTAASVVLVVGLAASVTGCAFITPQGTEIHYQASDGTEANVGTLNLRNFVAISDDGITANLVGAISNTSDSNVRVNLQYEKEDGSRVTIPVEVPAGGIEAVGYDNGETLLDDINTKPGGLLPVYVQYDDNAAEMQVPVLDGTQPQFATLVPTAVPSDAATPAPTATK